jgi:hypothetical protein
MRWSRVAVLTAAVLPAVLSAVLSAGPPAFAAGPDGPVAARCSFQYSPAISPGIGLLTDGGTVSSGGETGTVDCSGNLDGHEITGPGSWGFEGKLTQANCVEGGKGNGRISMTVPTDAGNQHFEEFITFGFGPAGAYPPLVGDWIGDRTSGLFVVAPAQGDCVTAPVTRADATGQFTLHGN